jgi:Asp-tRNA(Asn)/Glu-tRNA(Gln) amidotransferase C subunit
MSRRRPWPVSANEHRIAGIAAAHTTRTEHLTAIETILNDMERMKEYDRTLILLAVHRIGRHVARIDALQSDIERHLTLAKFGEHSEGQEE